MLSVHVDNVQDVAVVQCEGRIVHSDAAYTLRNAVTLQTDARAVVLDLSGVEALEGGGLGMLVFLRQWTRDRGFNLSWSIRLDSCGVGWSAPACVVFFRSPQSLSCWPSLALVKAGMQWL